MQTTDYQKQGTDFLKPEDFDYWCGEFGFDTDSRRAERIYKEVVKQWGQVSKFFTESEIEQLQEIN